MSNEQIWSVTFYFPGRRPRHAPVVKPAVRIYEVIADSESDAMLKACRMVREQLHHDKHHRSVRLWTIPTAAYARPFGRQFLSWDRPTTKENYELHTEDTTGDLTDEHRKLWEGLEP